MADNFRGDNSNLCESIDALLSLDASGSLVPHGIGGHARTLLESAATRLRALSPAGGGITADWVVGYLPMYADADTRKAVRYAFAEYEALLAASPQQEPGAVGGSPNPNWCRTCGKHRNDRMALLCVDRIHPHNAETKPTTADESGPSGQTLAGAGGDAMESWHSAMNDAGELFSNAPDDRFASRASRVLAWIKANRPATSAGTTGDALPELPEPEGEMKWTRSAGVCIRPEPGYDADQMREYARRAREVGNG